MDEMLHVLYFGLIFCQWISLIMIFFDNNDKRRVLWVVVLALSVAIFVGAIGMERFLA